MGRRAYSRGFELALHEETVDLPLRWRKPRTVFVNSMSDLFQENVPDEFIMRVFAVMNRASWHTFQVLTKRADRLQGLSSRLKWSANIWMGVSVENEDHVFRIDYLRETSAQLRFLSLEPLLGPLPELVLDRIDWVIVGGESGTGR
jgi:protein gp37